MLSHPSRKSWQSGAEGGWRRRESPTGDVQVGVGTASVAAETGESVGTRAEETFCNGYLLSEIETKTEKDWMT